MVNSLSDTPREATRTYTTLYTQGGYPHIYYPIYTQGGYPAVYASLTHPGRLPCCICLPNTPREATLLGIYLLTHPGRLPCWVYTLSHTLRGYPAGYTTVIHP